MSSQMNPILNYVIENDIELMVEKSNDFGQDIAQSFVRLAEKIGHQNEKRDCYGLITKSEMKTIYYAGFTQVNPNEAKDKNIETMNLPKGNYQSILIENWNQKLLEIGPTFDQILKSGKVDTMSPCIEFYKSESELICMVKALG
jgi:hypothetical protein